MNNSKIELTEEIKIAKKLLDDGLKIVQYNQDGSPRPVVLNKMSQFVWTQAEKFDGEQEVVTNNDIAKSRVIIPSYYAVFFSDKFVYVVFEEGCGYRFLLKDLTAVEVQHIKEHGEPVTMKFAEKILHAERLHIPDDFNKKEKEQKVEDRSYDRKPQPKKPKPTPKPAERPVEKTVEDNDELDNKSLTEDTTQSNEKVEEDSAEKPAESKAPDEGEEATKPAEQKRQKTRPERTIERRKPRNATPVEEDDEEMEVEEEEV